MKIARILLAVLALGLASVLAVANAAAQAEPAYVFSAAVPPFDGPKSDNEAVVIYNHFGSPSAGQAMISSVVFNPQSDLGLPISAQGRCRATRVHRVLRIALRCELVTFGGSDDDHAVGPTANNGNQPANPRIFLALTPTISTGGLTTDPQFCEAYQVAFYAIRWDDGTLSSGKVLTPPATWFNANCYLIPTSGAIRR